MALKLFHITEFAESTQLSPETQREALHPFSIVLLSSIWLTLVCNLPLWREFAQLPDVTPGRWWLAAAWALMMVLGLSALLSPLCWRRTLRPALTLLLMLAAVNTHLMMTQGTFVNPNALRHALHASGPEIRKFFSAQLLATLTGLAILPAVLIWRAPLRRIPLLRNLLQNASFFIACCTLLLLVWITAHKGLMPLLDKQQPLYQRSNPVNTLQLLGQRLAAEPTAPNS